MNKPSILKSVSISEMLHLREQGLTNGQIADKIGCSHATVIRHIGKAPFVKPGRGRKKKGIDALGLLPVGDKPIIEIPHKSFAERCEEMRKRGEETGKKVTMTENLHKEIPKCSEADIARVAHRRALGFPSPEYCIRFPAGEKHTVCKVSDYVDELVAVFGWLTVRGYLRCRLYELGLTHDAAVVDKDGLLEALKSIDKGGN